MKNVVFAALAFFAFALYSTGVSAQTADSTVATPIDTLKTMKVSVSGITCNGDMPVIKKKLLNEEGIEEVSFSKAKKGSVEFTIRYHSSVITEDKIRAAIEASPSCDDPNAYPFRTNEYKP